MAQACVKCKEPRICKRELGSGHRRGTREGEGQQEKMNIVHLDIHHRTGVTSKAIRTGPS